MENNTIYKKRVCISTWYGPTNYGTGLQACALYKYLNQMGYEVSYIEDCRNQKPKLKEESNFQKKMRRLLSIKRKFIFKQWIARQKYRKDIFLRLKMQNEFVNEFAPVIKIQSSDDVNRLNKATDIFISGGDQIWNPNVFEEIHFLSIANDDKLKISYGTSVGVQEIPLNFWPIYQKYLSRFAAISVRENQSKVALEAIINNKIKKVVDPTLLFDEEGWSFLTDTAEIDKKFFSTPYILCYFVGTKKTYWSYVEKIRKNTGYHVIVIPINNEGFVNPYDKYVKASPKEFLWMIQHAEIVCTDSFHATLFSIQYQKEFYTLKRFADSDKESQNGRLVDFLASLKLEDRLISDEKTFIRRSISTYDDIHEYLSEERKKSQEWLKLVLKGQN